MGPGDLARVMAPLGRKLRGMIARAVVHLVDDGRKMQELQVSRFADETKDRVERFENYGLTGHPPPGAEAVVLSIGEDSSHMVAVSVMDRGCRPKNLPAGDVALYSNQDDPSAAAKDSVHRLQLTADRTAILRCKRLDIRCGPQRIVMDEVAGITITTTSLDINQA